MNWLAALTLTLAWVSAMAAQSSDEQAIREARARSNTAIAAHDAAALANGWATDVSIVSSTGAQAVGRDANRERFAQQFTTRPGLIYIRRPTTIDVYAPWDVASERGEWTGRWTEADGAVEIGGTYLVQWRRLDGRWLIQAELYVPTRCSGSAYCTRRP